MSESNPNRPGHTENSSSVEKLIFQESSHRDPQNISAINLMAILWKPVLPVIKAATGHLCYRYMAPAQITPKTTMSLSGSGTGYQRFSSRLFRVTMKSARSGCHRHPWPRNIEESKTFYSYLQPDRPRAVIGYSMGISDLGSGNLKRASW